MVVFWSSLILDSVGLDPAPSGVRRVILRSHNRRSGPFELQQVENASPGGHITPANVVSLLHRFGLGLEPHLLLSQDYILRGCLNVLGASWRYDRLAISLTTPCELRGSPPAAGDIASESPNLPAHALLQVGVNAPSSPAGFQQFP